MRNSWWRGSLSWLHGRDANLVGMRIFFAHGRDLTATSYTAEDSIASSRLSRPTHD